MAVNEDLIRRTVMAMEENREKWDQGCWVETTWEAEEPICGTTMCFAGFAMLAVMGSEAFYAAALERTSGGHWQTTRWADNDIEDEAAEALGLDERQAMRLFGSQTDNLDAYKALITAVTGVAL